MAPSQHENLILDRLQPDELAILEPHLQQITI
jgi:hypothetical protein